MLKKFWTILEGPAQQKGNALIYVLIAIALFAALGFTLNRQTKGSNTSEINAAELEFQAAQLISYAAQTKSAIDQMMITGTSIAQLDFTKPGDAGFDTAPHIHKVFHPEGGGLQPVNLDRDVINQVESTAPGWYLENIINVEWTRSGATDVILTAYQINEPLCRVLNEKITGNSQISDLEIPNDLSDFFADTSSNQDFTLSTCGDCENSLSLCVANEGFSSYAFYTVIVNR